MPGTNTLISQAQEANTQFHASFLRQFAACHVDGLSLFKKAIDAGTNTLISRARKPTYNSTPHSCTNSAVFITIFHNSNLS